MTLRHAAALALVGWYLMTPPSRRDPLPHMTQPGRTYHDGARGAAGRLGSTSINPLGVPKLMASNVEPPGIVSHLPKRVEDRHFTYKVSSSRVHASVARELTKILRRMSRKQRVYTGLRVAVPPSSNERHCPRISYRRLPLYRSGFPIGRRSLTLVPPSAKRSGRCGYERAATQEKPAMDNHPC